MSVKPITIKNIVNSPSDIKTSKSEFAKYKEICKHSYISLATKKMEEGKKTVKAEDSVKGKIGFAKIRLDNDKLLSKMIEEKVRTMSDEPIQISSMVVEMIKIKQSKK